MAAEERRPFDLRLVEKPRRDPVLPRRHMPEVACAFCGSTDTEPVGIYGCHMMLSQYYCRSCHSSFDWVRDEWKVAGS